MTPPADRLSVIIPAWNAARYLGQAIAISVRLRGD